MILQGDIIKQRKVKIKVKIIFNFLCFLIILYIDGNDTPFYGIDELSKHLNVNRTNIINNIKGVTKTITTEKYGKIKINWKLNKEHCRLYMKIYGLSADEIEENPFSTEDNIELTSEITQGSEVM